MKMFKTHKTKMLLQGVADLQKIATRLRHENEQLINELNEAHRDMDNMERAYHEMRDELRFLQLKVKIKTESDKRLRGGH